MKKYLWLLTVLFLLSPTRAYTFTSDEQIVETLRNEFASLHQTVSQLKPDGMVGGLYFEKKYGDYSLLWKLAEEPGDNDVIRIYRSKNGFAVTFYRADYIVRGRTVIRRFIGPDQTGWRNDTFDEKTGEYLGQQGTSQPRADARDREILKKWNLTLFE